MKKDVFDINTREIGKRTRYYIDNELLKDMGKILKPQGIALYNVLAKHANSQTQSCFPSYETIMEQSGIGRRNTVTKYLNILEEHNIIYIERSWGKRPNLYYLLNNEEWTMNRIPIDTVENDNNFDNSIQYDLEGYPFGKLNNSSNATNTGSIDTLSHIIKQEKTNSYKRNRATFSSKKVGHEPQEITREEIEKTLDAMEEDLRKRGILPPTP